MRDVIRKIEKRPDVSFSVRSLALDFMFVIVLPNMFLFIVAQFASLNRPMVNFDYVVVSLIFLTGWRILGVTFLVVAFFFDVLFIMGQVVPILRVFDVFYLFGFLSIAPLSYQILLVLTLVVLFFKIFGYIKLSKRGIRLSTIILINVAVFFYVASVFVTDGSENRIWRVREVPLVSSLTVENFDLRQMGFVAKFRTDPEPLSKAQYLGRTAQWLEDPQLVPDRTLLIVSESWGVVDPAIMNDLLNPLHKIDFEEKSFETGELEFSGLTVEAELRELCGLTTSHFNLSSVHSGFEHCLPNTLKRSGYKTVGIHGAVGLMYDRAQWYPRAGFDEVVFFETHSRDRRCFSFPGACDIEVVKDLSQFFNDQSKVFLYWLTLNSHAFYDERDIVYDVFDCGKYNITLDSQVCRNLKLHAQFFYGLAEELEDPAFSGVNVLIVGDHQPPIIDKEEKAAYFAEKVVPWVSFTVSDKLGANIELRSR